MSFSTSGSVLPQRDQTTKDAAISRWGPKTDEPPREQAIRMERSPNTSDFEDLEPLDVEAKASLLGATTNATTAEQSTKPHDEDPFRENNMPPTPLDLSNTNNADQPSRKRKNPSPRTPPSSSTVKNDIPTTCAVVPGKAIPIEKYLADFRLLEEVEWGPRRDEDGYDSDQPLAPRPKTRHTEEICNCHTPPAGQKWTCRSDDCINYACREECRRINCIEKCGNQRLSRREFKQVEVFDAGPKGYGLRVLEDCVRGDIIQEYTGQAVRESSLAKLFRSYQQERRLYIMALDDKVFLDARKAGGLARFINHSCNPNCKVEKWRVKGIYRAAVEALRDIKAGTELTFDYQWSRKIGRAPTKCYCGEPNCRGTLEISRSVEEVQLERLLSGNWIAPKHKRADERIVNRTIRIQQRPPSHKEGQDNPEPFYSVAEITDYNHETKLHRILHADLEERWEDLNGGEFEWMLLDEELSPSRANAIARKKAPSYAGPSSTTSSMDHATKVNSGGGSLLTAFSSREKNQNEHLFYLYIQTPIKEAMFTQSNSLKERVERNCQVSITLQQQARPPLPCNTDDPEDVTKFAALDQSFDGTVWKISISGSDKDVAKAHASLSKNVQYWQKRQQQNDDLQKTLPLHAVGQPAMVSGARGDESTKLTDEVILPRAVVDLFKRKLPSVRERCRNVSIQITPSESKSKLIARLLLEGSLQTDLQNARIHIRNAMIAICKDLPQHDPLPMVNLGNGDKIPRDFGFLGGSLSKEEFESLLQNSSMALGRNASVPNGHGAIGPSDPATAVIRSKQKELSMASEELHQSPFFTKFEAMYGPLWIQSEDDMGRINGKNQLVGDATTTQQRKVYFGCEPKNIALRWALIHKRARDIVKGVRYIYLGSDHIYLRYLQQGNFFEFALQTTGATIMVDQSTGNHLVVDGTLKGAVFDDSLPLRVQRMTPVERADLAEELLVLQIEVYRDHFTRQESWIFGRDWTTINFVDEEPVPDNLKQIAASFGQLDMRSAPHSCMEISEVVAHLDLPSSVAAHAAIILYRFVAVATDTQMKARDSVLACVFIANKAQKIKRWKRLEVVLEAGYKTFYPGTHFDSEKEEVVKLQQRVLAAEQELLTTLEYDVFVRGMDSLEDAVTHNGGFADSVFSLAFCGQVLGAGANLWLKHGIEYIFAASAAVLKADLKRLVTTLGLIPIKVSTTLELIAENARYGKPTCDKVPSNPLLEGDRTRLTKHIPRVTQSCNLLAIEIAQNQSTDLSSDRLNDLHVSKSNLCVAIRGVSHQVVVDQIIDRLEGIEMESGCLMFLCPSASVPHTVDIRIRGPWQSVAIADFLLRSHEGTSSIPSLEEEMHEAFSLKIHAKTRAGLVDARELCTSNGWGGTLNPLGNKDHVEKQLGGKSCLAGKLSSNALKVSGLRWWIRRTKGLSSTGSITEMLSTRIGDGHKLEDLSKLAKSMEDEDLFPVLASLEKTKSKKDAETQNTCPHVAVSMQRWPSEKVSAKEQKRSKKSTKKSMEIGFSAGALQEMQLLTMLHKLVPSPHGHPNFILPVGIAIPLGEEQTEPPPTTFEGDDPMFSLFKTTQENESAAWKEKKVKSSPHLVFQPCPFVLQRFLSRKNNEVDLLEASSVLSSWFNDLVLALVHCHSNNIILRNLQPDQVIIDRSGVVKLSSFYRATVLGVEDRRHPPTINSVLKEIKKKGSSKKKDEDDDVSINPFVPPEILLGSPKFTKESDVWVVGCILANILLGKPPFVGKDKHSLLTSMYKIVGIPGPENFEGAVRFPNFVKPTKKYKRGVQKAMGHMVKSDYASRYIKAIDLVSRMLHLDPMERCSAKEALDHEFLREHREKIKGSTFRQSYVSEWMGLKSSIVQSSRYSNGDSNAQSQRRRTLMLATATGGDSNDENEDGLYNFEL